MARPLFLKILKIEKLELNNNKLINKIKILKKLKMKKILVKINNQKIKAKMKIMNKMKIKIHKDFSLINQKEDLI